MIMTIEKTNDEVNEELIRKAYTNSTKLHLSLKDRNFRNGYVKSCEESFFDFVDDILGEISIYFLKVYNVSPCKEANN